MKALRYLARRGGDLVVIGIFVGAEIEIWFVGSPHPKLALALLIPFWTLTMLARHRFPLAPALAFFVLAAESVVLPEVPQDSFASFLTVLVGFVFLGSALEKRRLPAAVAFLALAVHPSSSGVPHNSRSSGPSGHARPFRTNGAALPASSMTCSPTASAS